jgi:nitroreductase
MDPTIVPATAGPAPAAQLSVWEALKKRRSADAFDAQPLPRQKVLDLLWAAWGINRPESGKRTAPSAMNAQEMDLYVLMADGVYLYDAKQNQLTLVADQDLRAKAGGSKFRDAPVHLVFVADYARLRSGSQAQKELYSAAHCGFIGQNVYLYCAAEGLGTRFYAGIDAAALKTSLKLRADQAVLFGQAVGYSKG